MHPRLNTRGENVTTHVGNVGIFLSDDGGGDANAVSYVCDQGIPDRRHRRWTREFHFVRRRGTDLWGLVIGRGDDVVCELMKRSPFFSRGVHRRHGASSTVSFCVLRCRIVSTFFHRNRHHHAVLSYVEKKIQNFVHDDDSCEIDDYETCVFYVPMNNHDLSLMKMKMLQEGVPLTENVQFD